MNKDVIYIEPEDDITDIISRVRRANQKVVALVPPKKIGVLRSAVNTKLIAKAAREADKVAVIVTQDPSLIKLAATASLPVAKNLQSRPKLPSEIISNSRDNSEQVINEKDFDDEEIDETPKPAKKPAPKKPVKSPADQEFTSDDIEDDEEDGKKKKKPKKDNKELPAIEKYRKFIIAGVVGGVALIIFFVWAIVFAPSASISVAIRTTASNFSETVNFTTESNKEDVDKGIFLLEKQEGTKSSSVKFTATGKKDIGEKASGTLTVTASFNTSNAYETISVPTGAKFSYGEYIYETTSGIDFAADDECTNAQIKNNSCSISTKLKVVAVNPGENYNMSSTGNSFSSSIAGISATNSSTITGGTSKQATVVTQEDIEKAKSELDTSSNNDAKQALIDQFGDDMYAIDSSFNQTSEDPKPSVDVDQEANGEVTLTATVKYSIYAVDKNNLKKYISSKVGNGVAADQKVYEVDNMFFERFVNDEGKFSARLKATAQTGPKVTEQDIIEKSLGRKVGEVTSLIKSINGVSSVKVNTSFFWVNSVPKDINKVKIELKVEE